MPERVIVVGQGYVGLPVAMRAVLAGFDVTGLEVNPERVAALNAGQSHVEDISSTELAAAISTGRYRASSDPSDSDGFDIAVISVPTPMGEGVPDLSYIEAAAETLGPYVRPGCTVILESTTYPGTTDELVAPILERTSGLRAGPDFHLGYSPERIDPGNATYRLENTPKVVSGIDELSLEKVQGFFDRIIDTTVAVSGTREAELTKLLENTFRHVNIALVNELAVFAHGLNINVWEAIDAASTKPFGFMPFRPGPGVGGHCLPIDPSYLSWQVERSLGQTFRFVELANDVNSHMPDYVVQRATLMLNERERPVKGVAIGLFGFSYKANTGDARETPSEPVARLLQELGADLAICDPHVRDDQFPAGVRRIEGTASEIADLELVIYLVDHESFDHDRLVTSGTPILDTRHVLRGSTVEYL